MGYFLKDGGPVNMCIVKNILSFLFLVYLCVNFFKRRSVLPNERLLEVGSNTDNEDSIGQEFVRPSVSGQRPAIKKTDLPTSISNPLYEDIPLVQFN